MKNKIFKISMPILGIGAISSIAIPLLSSCSSIMDDELRELTIPWYDSLTNHGWNKVNGNFENYFCESEQQAIGLYSWWLGYFEMNHYIWLWTSKCIINTK